ncbi:hypothetical protein Dimus_013901, partial [Dionaea muscipula]
ACMWVVQSCAASSRESAIVAIAVQASKRLLLTSCKGNMIIVAARATWACGLHQAV